MGVGALIVQYKLLGLKCVFAHTCTFCLSSYSSSFSLLFSPSRIVPLVCCAARSNPRFDTFKGAATIKGTGLDKWNVDKVTDFQQTFTGTTSMTDCNKRLIAYATSWSNKPAFASQASPWKLLARTCPVSNTPVSIPSASTRHQLHPLVCSRAPPFPSPFHELPLSPSCRLLRRNIVLVLSADFPALLPRLFVFSCKQRSHAHRQSVVGAPPSIRLTIATAPGLNHSSIPTCVLTEPPYIYPLLHHPP